MDFLSTHLFFILNGLGNIELGGLVGYLGAEEWNEGADQQFDFKTPPRISGLRDDGAGR